MSTATMTNDLLGELAWRGLLFQHTEGLPAWLSGHAPVRAYCGFDPTAPSLHVGSLVPVMGLVHLLRAGHLPIALVGGGTGLIGDPSGKAQERQLSAVEVVEANASSIHRQLNAILGRSVGGGDIPMRNNAAWLTTLGAVEFMRDVGKHFSVNVMLAKESVKARLETGISYTEFSYLLLQAYDFLELRRRDGVSLQIGGSDQWGNITAGVELIRRTLGAEAHGLTLPLVTTASGTKFGKTEAGAVWLDPALCSPYRFYQFWVNTDDRDVGRYLRFFTLLGREEIEALDRETAERPERREAQRALAREVTTRVHGEEAASAAQQATDLLFGQKEVPWSANLASLRLLENEIPTFRIDATTAPTVRAVVDAVCGEDRLLKSKGEARRAIQQGGLYVNGKRVSEDQSLPVEPVGAYVLVRKGARNYALVKVGG